MVVTLFRVRWPAYAGLVLALFALESAVHALFHDAQIDIATASIAAAIAETIAIVLAARDAGYLKERVGVRVLDRAWAVVVLEFIWGLLNAIAVQSFDLMSGNPLVGTLLLMTCAFLIYAPAEACLGDQRSPLRIVPSALARSLLLSWGRVSRTFALFSIVLGVELCEMLVQLRLVYAHRPAAAFWALTPIDAVASIALAVIFTAAYIDMAGRERQ